MNPPPAPFDFPIIEDYLLIARDSIDALDPGLQNILETHLYRLNRHQQQEETYMANLNSLMSSILGRMTRTRDTGFRHDITVEGNVFDPNVLGRVERCRHIPEYEDAERASSMGGSSFREQGDLQARHDGRSHRDNRPDR